MTITELRRTLLRASERFDHEELNYVVAGIWIMLELDDFNPDSLGGTVVYPETLRDYRP